MEFERYGNVTRRASFLFPSPCGVMEFELFGNDIKHGTGFLFPSPCGVMEFEPGLGHNLQEARKVSVPLRGNGI